MTAAVSPRRVRTRVLLLLALILALGTAHAWREWTWTNADGPSARRGHSMVLHKSRLIVFGGRANDTTKLHEPKTFATQVVNGSLEFLLNVERTVRSSDVPVGVFLNDVSSYNINCTRYADESCLDATWQVLDPGAVWGGCAIVLGAYVCSHPAERWFHRAEVFDDDSMLIYGGFSPLCGDYCNDMWQFNLTDNTWTELAEIGNTVPGPGKRFKFSSVVRGAKMYVFGGFRLWHGFAHENSVDNDWSEFSQYPRGGYLNDLWVYDKQLNVWSNCSETVVCPDLTLLQRLEGIEVECTLTWPPGRAGHASVLYQDAIYIHGGYRTFFPYPSTTGPGAGRGILTMRGVGFTPFPTHPYFLQDLWKFNLTTGLWEDLTAGMNASSTLPPARLDHSLVVVGDIFLLFGGYVTNYYFDDTWQYNITFNRWRHVTSFVHAEYPPSCTDDLAPRKMEHSGNYRAFEPGPDVPDDLNGYYFVKERHYGAYTFSVLAEPTRGTTDTPVFVSQSRRQAPGWDGCRDRADNRQDLSPGLMWIHPSQRSGHAATYHAGFAQVFVFGGFGYASETRYDVNRTVEAAPLRDLWQYNPHACPKNCSLHGECLYGACRCRDGYYGEDCSNSTCPGSWCWYDDQQQQQICEHCCFSGFAHTDNDSYVPNLQKYPCTQSNLHYANGVCDGFGMCICRPPFVGDDCSIRDCANNCTGHGYCSLEFPNSRCMCDDGWFGKYCEQRMCLNNCSYPNGVCLNGSCYCAMVYEPYNNTHEYLPLMGEDCSFLLPFAEAMRASPTASKLLVAIWSLLGAWWWLVRSAEC